MKKTHPSIILLYESNAADIALFDIVISEFKDKISYEVHKDISQSYNYISSLNKLPDLIIMCSTILLQFGIEEIDKIKIDLSLKSIPMIILTEFEEEIKYLMTKNYPNMMSINKPFSLDEASAIVGHVKRFIVKCRLQEDSKNIVANC